MKIYTKTGDQGETGLVGGKRLSKADLRIQTYGSVDELNAVLGVAGSFLDAEAQDIQYLLSAIQETLFVVGAQLATPPDYHGKQKVPGVTPEQISALEKHIDHYDAELPKLQHFILPSGGKAGSLLHLARTVCRRAERDVVRLSQSEKIGGNIMVYLNRLSDLLFVLARVVNTRQNQPEIPWKT